MKKSSSRIVWFLLLVVVGICVVANAAATSDSTEGWWYQRVEGGLEIANYDGPDVEHLVIPSEIGGEPVIGIGNRGLWVNKMKTVSIPESVTYIRERAFEQCYNLTAIEIPKNVTSIGEGAFGGCTALETITVEPGNENFVIANRSLVDKNNRSIIAYPEGLGITEYTVPSGIVRIGAFTFDNCDNLISIIVPDSVISIGRLAFYDCNNLRSVRLPEGLIDIEDWAFIMCDSLSDISIPESVERIGESAFYWCSSLTSISIPANVQEIGTGAFGGTSSLKWIELDKKNEYYEWVDYAIVDKATRKLVAFPCGYSAVEYTIPNSVLSIGSDAFRAADGIDNLIIPDGVTTLDEDAFGAANFQTVYMADSVVEMGEAAFQYGDFELLRLSSGLREIKKDAFFNNNTIKTIEIPRGIVSIGESAFGACQELEDVVISDTVKTIGTYAFASCSGLERVFISSSIVQIGSEAFADCPDTLILMGKEGSYAQSYAQENGITFQAVYDENDLPIGLLTASNGNELNIIGYNGILVNLIVPSVVQGVPITKINDWAFYWNDTLTSIVLPESINAIGEMAFAGCEQLQRVFIEEGTQSIGKQAFAYCPMLETLYIPSSVRSIATNAFENSSENLVIYGLSESYAQSFAQKFGIGFEKISTDEMVSELSRQVVQEGQETKAIIIVPGIMGSELTDYRDSTIYWVGGLTIASEFLQFTDDGTPAYPYIGAWRNGAMDEYGALGIYTKLVNSLKDTFGSEYDVQFFAYDWRCGNAVTSEELENAINQMGYDSVVFVAHSMGGLVVSSYIKKAENKAKVEKVITLGTPFLGSTKALLALENGDLFFNLTDKITSQAVKDLAINLPSIYELIPFWDWIDVNVPLGQKYTTIPMRSYYQIMDFIKTQRTEINDFLFDQALDSFQSLLIENNHIINTLGNKLYCIYGTGYDTPDRLIYNYSTDWVSVDWQSAIDSINSTEDFWSHIQPGGFSLEDITTSTYGDGTVSRNSATIYNTIEQSYEYKVDHLALASDDAVIERIISIINDVPLLISLPYPATDINGLGNDVNYAAFYYYDNQLIYENQIDSDNICISSFEDFINQQNQRYLYSNSSYPNAGIVGSGDYVYHFESNKLIKTEITSGISKEINTGLRPFADNFIFYEDRLYFTTSPYGDNDTKADNIYSINTDGTNLTKLNEAAALEMTISEGWIYYVEVHTGFLYRISIEGQNKQLLHRGDGYNIVVFKDWVYLIDFYQEGQLVKVKTDGSEIINIGDIKTGCFNIVDSWIYYQNNGEIYRTTISNPQISEFLVSIEGSDSIREMNIVGGYVFFKAYYTEHHEDEGYSNILHPTGIYMMSLDGSVCYLIWDLSW